MSAAVRRWGEPVRLGDALERAEKWILCMAPRWLHVESTTKEGRVCAKGKKSRIECCLRSGIALFIRRNMKPVRCRPRSRRQNRSGRSSDFQIILLAASSQPFLKVSDVSAAVVPGHSGGPVPELHGVPSLCSYEHLNVLRVKTIASSKSRKYFPHHDEELRSQNSIKSARPHTWRQQRLPSACCRNMPSDFPGGMEYLGELPFLHGEAGAMGRVQEDLGRLSEAKRMMAPTIGVRNKLQKKYPQKPNFLLIPNRAISTVKARYIGTILMLYPGNGVNRKYFLQFRFLPYTRSASRPGAGAGKHPWRISRFAGNQASVSAFLSPVSASACMSVAVFLPLVNCSVKKDFILAGSKSRIVPPSSKCCTNTT